MAKKKKNLFDPSQVEKLNIPEDEIWTYAIEGLQKPRIVNRSVSVRIKAVIIAVLAVSISVSLYMSIRAVSNDEFKYSDYASGTELVKFSNTDNKKEVRIDFAGSEKSKPVTEIREYAFNCDERIETVYLGKDICRIDSKSFFSCKSLRNIFVDDDNPCYCDIDGILYNKDRTELICCPPSHCLYLVSETGYSADLPEDGSVSVWDFRSAVRKIYDAKGDAALFDVSDSSVQKFSALTGVTDYAEFYKAYMKNAAVCKIADSVRKIGELAFAYSDYFEIEIPEGVETIDSMAFFRMDNLCAVRSYKDRFVYDSLPEGLEKLGSDCFSFDSGLTEMFIPRSVREIGHHAFYNTCYKEGDSVKGISVMKVAADEEQFKAATETGENWLSKFDSGLFQKSIDIAYDSSR